MKRLKPGQKKRTYALPRKIIEWKKDAPLPGNGWIYPYNELGLVRARRDSEQPRQDRITGSWCHAEQYRDEFRRIASFWMVLDAPALEHNEWGEVCP